MRRYFIERIKSKKLFRSYTASRTAFKAFSMSFWWERDFFESRRDANPFVWPKLFFLLQTRFSEFEATVTKLLIYPVPLLNSQVLWSLGDTNFCPGAVRPGIVLKDFVQDKFFLWKNVQFNTRELRVFSLARTIPGQKTASPMKSYQ